MKYFITGLHSSGKQEVIEHLKNMGVKCGNLFTNFDELNDDIYNAKNYEVYRNEDINEIFENDAYIFLQELPRTSMNFKTGRYYEGLSKYNFDQNDVFVLSPDQLLSIVPNSIKEDICFIWMDNTKDNRASRYYNEKRSYNYIERDSYEKRDLNSYVKTLYSFNNSNLIYFNDEVPQRVATIIYTMIKHPDMIETFVKNFD